MLFLCCIIRYKDTNLKAIHNWTPSRPTPSTLYYPIQRYKFESNSQLFIGCKSIGHRCIIRYKDTNLKAIHNIEASNSLADALYYPIQRYKFESNSQLIRTNSVECGVVLSDTKIQIWKQFTTRCRACHSLTGLYYPIQRYKFESNSQRSTPRSTFM